MADDVLEDAGPAPEAGKVKREPPTIDLEATKVSETASAESKPSDDKPSESKLSESKPSEEQPAVDTAPEDKPAEPKSNAEPDRTAAAISPWVIAPVSGAVAASLVILVGWLLGWPTVQAPPAAPQVSAAAVDDLGKRVAGLESKDCQARGRSRNDRADRHAGEIARLLARRPRQSSCAVGQARGRRQ